MEWCQNDGQDTEDEYLRPVWPTFFLLNASNALGGTHFYIPFDVTAAVVVPFGGSYLKSSPHISCKGSLYFLLISSEQFVAVLTPFRFIY